MIDITYPDILTITGLTLDAVGIVFLFWHAPEKHIHPWLDAYSTHVGKEKETSQEWKVKQSTREKIAKLSVLMIVLGFGLQACAVLFW